MGERTERMRREAIEDLAKPLAHSTTQEPRAEFAERRCPYCGSTGVARIRGLQGPNEVLTCFALCLLLLIPGVIYYIYMESIPYCTGCGRRVGRS